MCGIDGIIVHGQAAPVSQRELDTMTDAQAHRGPDDAGTWICEDGTVGFGHRRLSIVDLSPSGHQPMHSRDGRFSIVFNGEIYNFLSLRRELEAKGHQFVSTSDTEVLIEGYRAWGLSLLDRLRGMFVFALHDATKRETLLVRDPLGIKPLYVADLGGRLAFASEVQALRPLLTDDAVDPQALASYLIWGSIAPPRTLHRGIRALPPGSWLLLAPGRSEGPRTYYRIEDDLGRAQPMQPGDAAEALREALVDSVRHHLIADVPVGSFLSGGVDSSALVGLMAELHDAPIRTITLSMDAAELDEGRLARQAATLYGTDHHDIPTGIEQIRERMPAAIASLDQPSIDGVNTFFVSEAAVRAGLKVAVSGVGGDELFGGYATFRTVPAIERVHRIAGFVPFGRALTAGLAGGIGGLPRSRMQSRIERALAFGGDTRGAYFASRGLFTPREVRNLLAPGVRDAVEACGPQQELQSRVDTSGLPYEERVFALEFSQYLQCQLLRDTDATAMRHSLEVRTPLVDRELLRAAARIPAPIRQAGPAKKNLRTAPRPPVPDALWARKKQGFTLPFERWLRGGGIRVELPRHDLLDPAGVESVARDFSDGRVHWSRLWSLLVLQKFLP